MPVSLSSSSFSFSSSSEIFDLSSMSQNKILSLILSKHNENRIIMSESSQRITRLQTHEIVCQYSLSSAALSSSAALLSSAASLKSEAQNVLQSLVTAELQHEVHLQKEQNFNTSAVALVYIKSLSLQDQYSLLEELNTTLNQFQASVLDVQSDIVDYL